jgi:hypothetical protein
MVRPYSTVAVRTAPFRLRHEANHFTPRHPSRLSERRMPLETSLQPRPALFHWLRDRGLDYSTGGKLLGCSRETLRRYCLPFADEKRRFPKRQLLRKIADLTQNQVTGRDFVEPLENAQPEAA